MLASLALAYRALSLPRRLTQTDLEGTVSEAPRAHRSRATTRTNPKRHQKMREMARWRGRDGVATGQGSPERRQRSRIQSGQWGEKRGWGALSGVKGAALLQPLAFLLRHGPCVATVRVPTYRAGSVALRPSCNLPAMYFVRHLCAYHCLYARSPRIRISACAYRVSGAAYHLSWPGPGCLSDHISSGARGTYHISDLLSGRKESGKGRAEGPCFAGDLAWHYVRLLAPQPLARQVLFSC